jgi:hypothetical protein
MIWMKMEDALFCNQTSIVFHLEIDFECTKVHRGIPKHSLPQAHPEEG